MGVNMYPTFDERAVRAYLQQFLSDVEDVIVRRFKIAGEMFANLARENGGYTDRTGNLKSSVGYIILYNGIPIFRDFKQVLGGSIGKSKGEQMAMEFAPKTGFVLVGVAGMDYAAAVESRGKDVISGSADHVEDWMITAFKSAA